MADEEMGFGEEEFGGEGFGFGFEEEADAAPPADAATAADTATATAAATTAPAAATTAAAGEAAATTDAPPPAAAADSTATGNGAATTTGETSVGNISQDIGHEQDVRTEKSGWLKVIEAKKTLSRRGPKERWFTLAKGKLAYAASVRADAINEWPLTAITHIHEGDSGQPETFTIVTPKKTLAVVARDEADAKLWVACIRKAQKSNTDAAFGQSTTGNALLF